MKNIILLLLLHPFSAFAQKEQGSIIYEMFFDLNNWKTNGELNPEMRKLMENVKRVSFTLLYNSQGMILWIIVQTKKLIV